MEQDPQDKRIDRRPQRMAFAAHPTVHVRNVTELLGIALAIETEAVNRYRQLAAAMASRGEAETAAVFANMAQEEEGHIRAVHKLAAQSGCPNIQPEPFAWRLPPEFAESWDEVAGSALLTAYRALAIAVDNEQRAFSFYAFIAAEAEDTEAVRFAEALAREELTHAGLLRKWRRGAYRRSVAEMPPDDVTSPAALDRLIAAHEQKIAESLDTISQRLVEGGADQAAVVLHGLVGTASRRAVPPPFTDGRAPESIASSASRGALLNAAQKPLEQLAEKLERTILESASEEVRNRAAGHLADVLQRLATLRSLDDNAAGTVNS